MAEQGQSMEDTWTAAADLRLHQYLFMRASAAEQMNVASNPAIANAGNLIGVLTTKPNSGQHGTVRYFGDTKVVAGGALTANTYITSNGSGRAAAATSGDLVAGLVKQTAGADGEIVTARLFPPFALTL